MVRLQKFLADAGVASRRASEKIIAEGRVAVNGEIIREMGVQVDENYDEVIVDGERIKNTVKKEYIMLNKENTMIVSPDEGAMGRCIYYSSVLGMDLGMFYKRRDYSRVVNGKNPIVAHEFLGTDLNGKNAIVIDDMISSGDSMIDVSRELKKRKASRVFVFSTFGLFTEGFDRFDKAYEEGLIEGVFTTNLIYAKPELLSKPWYHQVDMSKYVALRISELNAEHSISELLNPIKRIEKILDKYNNM